jgi:hypothetical protein
MTENRVDSGHSNGLGFAPDTPAIIQRTVIEGQTPALVVIHDDEGDWLVADGVNDPNVPGASGLFHIAHLLQLDPSISAISDLPVGFAARRSSPDAPWIYEPFSYSTDH